MYRAIDKLQQFKRSDYSGKVPVLWPWTHGTEHKESTFTVLYWTFQLSGRCSIWCNQWNASGSARGIIRNECRQIRIYQTRANRNHCKNHRIRLSESKLGWPGTNSKIDKKQEYQNNTDRIKVERTFCFSKHCYGMNCITTKLKETQLTSIITLYVFVMNLFKIQRRILFVLLYLFRLYY